MKGRRGGKRPGAGRRKGSVAKATKEHKGTIGEFARRFDAIAMNTLAQIAEHGQSESARVAASNAILDRGYGRPPQSVELTGKNGGPMQTIGRTMTPQEAAAAYANTLHGTE